MNYLAHFYLSGDRLPLLLGNFIADAVKGSHLDAYPADIQEGIRMHRAIDFFTDTHPVTSRSKDRIRAQFNHYSGVVIDIFYDHFLARDWHKYSKEPLPEYSRRIYALLELHVEIFPERPRHMLPFMKHHDWLVAYSTVEGIKTVLTGMSRRVRPGSKMELAAEVLVEKYAEFEGDFVEFFPEVVKATEGWRKG